MYRTPYREIRTALNDGTFSSEWVESNRYGRIVNSNEGMEIAADRLSRCRSADDAGTALQILTELFEPDVRLDGEYYYASSSYVDWLKRSIQRDGMGTIDGKDFQYSAYGYQVKWNSNMVMNQLYLYVEADNDWHIITVSNGFCSISESNRVGIE